MSHKSYRTFINQYGRVYYARNIKELRTKIPGRCGKMYIDTKTGTQHIGYVIGSEWLTEYTIVRKLA